MSAVVGRARYLRIGLVSLNGCEKGNKWENSQVTIISHCTVEALARAANTLRDGKLVIFPTETVYGVGADAENASAVARIYEIKGRPRNHPVIVHIASLRELEYWIDSIPEYALALARNFWPGSMTLILPRSRHAGDFLTGGQESVGIRIPSHPLALKLLEEFHLLGGRGVAAPSANLFGRVSPTTAQAAEEQLGPRLADDEVILDGGPCLVGIESTVIDCTSDSPRILRPGAITEEMIEEATSLQLVEREDAIRASGLLENHYAPHARVLVSGSGSDGAGFLALADIPTPPRHTRLASPKTIEEYARVLYSALREADSRGLSEIVIVPPPGDGIAVAICDRIEKARSK
ncbi:MAG: L-threonylcarbamoyladenylate synthase [Candidatus Nanopelagicaceae bacterium]